MYENGDKKGFFEALVRDYRNHAILLAGFVVFLWALEILDWMIFRGGLDVYGVIPRSLIGLRGILFAPLLHSGFAHLVANTLPLLILGGFVLLRGIRGFFSVTAIVILFSGLGIWLFGSSDSVHIGASGIIFGYFGYLLFLAYYERSIQSFFFAVLVMGLYGYFFLGVLPQSHGVSWQGHLFGFLGGWLSAYLLTRRKQDRDK